MTNQYTRPRVTAENLTDFFDISTQAQQADPLSTTLFNLGFDSEV
jgi:hypothetical protein